MILIQFVFISSKNIVIKERNNVKAFYILFKIKLVVKIFRIESLPPQTGKLVYSRGVVSKIIKKKVQNIQFI